MVSIADIFSDIICALIYINSNDPYLMNLGYISFALLLFTTLMGALFSWLFKGPWWEVLLSFIGLGPIADTIHAFKGDTDPVKTGRPINLDAIVMVRRMVCFHLSFFFF